MGWDFLPSFVVVGVLARAVWLSHMTIFIHLPHLSFNFHCSCTGHVLISRLQEQRIQLYVSTISNVSQIKVCTELQFMDLKLNHLCANYLGVLPYKLYQVNSPAPYQLLEYNPSTMNPFECKLSLFISSKQKNVTMWKENWNSSVLELCSYYMWCIRRFKVA
jgi:hypothetical protein